MYSRRRGLGTSAFQLPSAPSTAFLTTEELQGNVFSRFEAVGSVEILLGAESKSVALPLQYMVQLGASPA